MSTLLHLHNARRAVKPADWYDDSQECHEEHARWLRTIDVCIVAVSVALAIVCACAVLL